LQYKFDEFKQWFDNYTRQFKSDDEKIQRNFDLKILHTRKVYENAVVIAEALGLPEEDTFVAKVAALFHDVGRFEQFQQYNTFIDKHSVNHAELGLDILAREQLFESLPEDLSEKIVTAIEYHNKLEVPENMNYSLGFHARLLRDADKLDIFRVVTEYYEQQKSGDHNEAIVLGLPDDEGFTNAVISDIKNREIVKSQDLQTINDFKLLQAAWVFDINFSITMSLIKERKFIHLIFQSLPDYEDIALAQKIITDHMENHCKKEKNAVLF